MAERGALVITWGGPQPGVGVAKGLEVFAKALGYYDELAKEGRIAGYRVFASTASARGMLTIEGELSQLASVQIATESTKLLAIASAVVQDMRVELFAGGSADDATQYYMTAFQALTEAGLAG
jgi:hypothetical protein